MIVTQDLTTTTTGTGITGDMILIGDGIPDSLVSLTPTGGIIIFGILFLAGVIAHLADRRFSLREDLE